MQLEQLLNMYQHSRSQEEQAQLASQIAAVPVAQLFELAIGQNNVAAAVAINSERICISDIQNLYSVDLSKTSYAVTGAIARAVSKAVCADPALFTQVQDTLINDNSMLTQLIVVNVYRFRQPRSMNVLRNFARARLEKPIPTTRLGLEITLELVRLADRLDPGQLGAVSAAANQIFGEQSELACEVMTQAFVKLNKKEQQCVDFQTELVRGLAAQGAMLETLDYTRLKAVVRMHSGMCVELANRRPRPVLLLLECAAQFYAPLANIESHYIFQHCVQFFQKLYEQRELLSAMQMTQPTQLDAEGRDPVKGAATAAAARAGFGAEDIAQIGALMPQLNNLVLDRTLFYLNKAPIKSALIHGCAGSPCTLLTRLEEDYAQQTVVEVQEWFAMFKQDLIGLAMKLTTLFPTDALQFIGSRLQTTYEMLAGLAPQTVTMHSDEYMALDAALSLYEEVARCTLKLSLHENDFLRTRGADPELLVRLVEAAASSAFPTLIQQNVCVYRWLSAIAEIPKFIQRFGFAVETAQHSAEVSANSKAQKNQKGRGKRSDNPPNQVQLLMQNWRLTKQLVSPCLRALLGAADYRTASEANASGALYASLTQDTLAVRRQTCTRLESYFSSRLIVGLFLLKLPNRNFDLNEILSLQSQSDLVGHDGFPPALRAFLSTMTLDRDLLLEVIGFIDGLANANRLTEREKLGLTSAKLNLLVSSQALGVAVGTDQADYVRGLLGSILAEQRTYFANLKPVLNSGQFGAEFGVRFDLPHQPISGDFVTQKRALMFKLSEVRDVWTRVWGAKSANSLNPANTDNENIDIDTSVTYIVDTVEQLFDQLLGVVSEQPALPAEFVYRCNPLKINLSAEAAATNNAQYTTIDVDEPQSIITMDAYILEWLDKLFELEMGILLQTNRTCNVARRLESGAQQPLLPLNYQKIAATLLVRQFDPDQTDALFRLSTAYLQTYVLADLYNHVPARFDTAGLIAQTLGSTGAPAHTEVMQALGRQLGCTRQDIQQDQLDQIAGAVWVVGLRQWIDLICKCAYDSQTNVFRPQFVAVYGHSVLTGLGLALMVASQDLRAVGQVLTLLGQLALQTPVRSPLICQLLVVTFLNFRNNSALREQASLALARILTESAQANDANPMAAVLSFCRQSQADAPALVLEGEGTETLDRNKATVQDWLCWVEDMS